MEGGNEATNGSEITHSPLGEPTLQLARAVNVGVRMQQFFAKVNAVF